jgi:hypothetical protein
MATSTAQADSGVFELSFRDERYLPFEGAGAISDWSLRLPANFREFNYSTITDVILNVSYTAEAHSGLRADVESVTGTVAGSIAKWLKDNTLVRIVSLRQDFSSTFTRLVNSALGTEVDLQLDDRAFPYWLRTTTLRVTKARIAVRTARGVAPVALSMKVGNGTVSGFTADDTLSRLYTKITTALGTTMPIATRLAIQNAGALARPAGAGDGGGAVDEQKLDDILLVLEYSSA